MSLSPDVIFEPFSDVLSENALAIAVSGGPDSMALAVLLSEWLRARGWSGTLHALTVDHGLRDESAREAQGVAASLAACPLTHAVLKWEGDKPASRVQETARNARYELMNNYCRARGISRLFLAHHQHDQAETFLMRLAAGSGLDGLAGMAMRQDQGGVTLLRPLLSVPKMALVDFCRQRNIGYVQDPSNSMDKFARVRLRESAAILEKEGLSAKRLSLTARRLARAREMLEAETKKFIAGSLKNKDTDRLVFDYSLWRGAYDELVFRALRNILQTLSAAGEDGAGYGPRMESLEAVAADLLKSAPFRKRTLGGADIWVDARRDEIILRRQAVKKP